MDDFISVFVLSFHSTTYNKRFISVFSFFVKYLPAKMVQYCY